MFSDITVQWVANQIVSIGRYLPVSPIIIFVCTIHSLRFFAKILGTKGTRWKNHKFYPKSISV